MSFYSFFVHIVPFIISIFMIFCLTRRGQSCSVGAVHHRDVCEDVRPGSPGLLHVPLQPLRLLRGALRHLGDDHVLGRRRSSTGLLRPQVHPAAEDLKSHKVSPTGAQVHPRPPKLNQSLLMTYHPSTFAGTGRLSAILWLRSSTLCAPSLPCSSFSSSSLSSSHCWACRCLAVNSTLLTTDLDAVTSTTSLRLSSVCFR